MHLCLYHNDWNHKNRVHISFMLDFSPWLFTPTPSPKRHAFLLYRFQSTVKEKTFFALKKMIGKYSTWHIHFWILHILYMTERKKSRDLYRVGDVNVLFILFVYWFTWLIRTELKESRDRQRLRSYWSLPGFLGMIFVWNKL